MQTEPKGVENGGKPPPDPNSRHMRRERQAAVSLYFAIPALLLGALLWVAPQWFTHEITRTSNAGEERRPAERWQAEEKAKVRALGDAAAKAAQAGTPEASQEPGKTAAAERPRKDGAEIEARRKTEEAERQRRESLLRRAQDQEEGRRLLAEQRRKAALERMKEAKVEFNTPEEMYLGRRAQITLVLDPSNADNRRVLESAFERRIEGQVTTATLKVADRMLARLHGKSFRIEAAGPEEQAVADAPVRWTWYIVPLDPGQDRLLLLELFALLDDGQAAAHPIKTLEYRIRVNVRMWDNIMRRLGEAAPLSLVISSFGMIGTVWGFYWKLDGWRRRRQGQRQSPRGPAPG